LLEQAGGGTLFLLVAIGLSVLAAAALLEAWMLLNGRKPITGYVREGIRTYPKIAAGAAFIVGLLMGHFWR
jgi:hypothetical protein